MFKATRSISALVAICLAVAGLAACGGGVSGNVVAQVGGSPITKAMLNHWMLEVTGEDYYASSTHRAPRGLVSEPPNYPACIAALEAVAPFPGKGQPKKPTVAQLETKCRLLYQAIKQQALSFLVSSYREVELDAAHGIKVTDEEIKQHLERVKAERFPRNGELQQYLANRNRTLSDELFLMKLNLLSQKTSQDIPTGGKQLTKLIEEAKAFAASCRTGYVVEDCRQYKGPETTSIPSPSVILQEIARWRPETSHGFTGVPVTG